MMGHREKLKSAIEYDALTNWRKVLKWRPGQRKAAKRTFNKRFRSHGQIVINEQWMPDDVRIRLADGD